MNEVIRVTNFQLQGIIIIIIIIIPVLIYRHSCCRKGFADTWGPKHQDFHRCETTWATQAEYGGHPARLHSQDCVRGVASPPVVDTVGWKEYYH